jgi:hypothetical protein
VIGARCASDGSLEVPLERSDGARERPVHEGGGLFEVDPTERGAGALAGGLAGLVRRCIPVRMQEVPQVEMDVAVGARVLVEVQEHRAARRVSDRDTRLLEGLADRCVLRALTRLDVATGLEPAADPAVEVEQDLAMSSVEDDGRRRDVGRERRPHERVLRAVEEALQVCDSRRLLVVEDRMAGEDGPQPDGAVVGPAGVEGRRAGVRGQRSTSLEITAPVVSSS